MVSLSNQERVRTRRPRRSIGLAMSGMPPPSVPNPFDDDASRLQRAEANVEQGNLIWKLVFVGGLGLLGLWVVLAMMGIGGWGVLLAPIGLGMVIGAGVQLFIDRISAL